jgi:hypothetical protein
MSFSTIPNHPHVVVVIDTFVEEQQRVGTMATRYKVLGSDAKATSEGRKGLVEPAWDQEEMIVVALID